MSSSEAKVILCQSSACPNGNPPSRLECPTCSKLGVQGSYFCGQACFKAGCKQALKVQWFPIPFSMTDGRARGTRASEQSIVQISVFDLLCGALQKTHKIIHDLVKPKSVASNLPDGVYNPFPNFQYTGSVQPWYPLTARRRVPEHIQLPDYAHTGKPLSEIKLTGSPPHILSEEEQQKMRTVCRLGREILDIAASHVRPGITTDEIDEIVHNATIERNSYPSPLNYRNFPKSVCTSVNEVICHGIPDKRPLQEGDIINIDVSVYHDGFHADLNETIPVGRIDDDSAKLISVTQECLNAAIAICKPGALFRDIGKAIEPIAKAAGCSVVRSYTGHGVNQLFHASPNYIPHYAKNKAVGTMKPGMAFTIEPMINWGPSWSEVHWPDNWTATTVDGKRSAQFEDTLLITETGVEILTAGARHKKTVWP